MGDEAQDSILTRWQATHGELTKLVLNAAVMGASATGSVMMQAHGIPQTAAIFGLSAAGSGVMTAIYMKRLACRLVPEATPN